MKHALYAASIALLASACASDDPVAGDAPISQASGSYRGSYSVPTDESLAAAAVFAMDDVDWSVAAGTATLHYNLPRGLVGGKLAITLTGPLAAGATTVALSGAQGTGTCTATGTVITCREAFADLGALPISMDVVQQVAASEYAGPVADRAHVATLFGSDPIGSVQVLLTAPAIDDGGGGSGAR